MASNTDDQTIVPTVVLPVKKRRVETNWTKCVFCQGTDTLSCSSQQGIHKVYSSLLERLLHESTDLVTRLRNDLSSVDHLLSKQPKWHKSCYASFTNRSNIDLVKKRHSDMSPFVNTDGASGSTRPQTRIIVPKVDWKKCIYCQSRKRDKVRQVQSDEVEATIKGHAKFDENLKCRIGENDLISYEAHYHPSCKYKANRPTDPDVNSKIDPSLDQLILILDAGFKRGHIYSMDSVVEKYVSLMSVDAIPDPSCRTHVLKQKLQRHYADRIVFRKQRQANQPLLLMASSATTDDAIGMLMERFPEELEPDEISPESHFLCCLHTVTTKLKADMKIAGGHKGYDDLNQEAEEKCIPTSVYLLMKWIIQDELNPGEHSEPDCDNSPNDDISPALHQRILNVCQDIVYNVSMGRKNTPKHIGTGLFVHHLTRSKQLIEYLHMAGDSTSYPTVNRIDSSIAQSQISRFEENDNTFVPEGVVPGKFVQFAADNFDMQEETLDGKGTLHVTQMAVFQRGPPNPQSKKETTIGRRTSIGNIPPTFHHITPSEAPPQHVPPRFSLPVTNTSLDCPASRRSECEKIDLAWVMSRLTAEDAQHIPAWTGFNQSLVKPSEDVTTVGYLPIIPAPAHELDTVMTFLLRSKAIAAKLGQTKTVITLDQVLYHKAKELVWLLPEKLSDVIVRLGAFHTAMNFLGVLGSHFAQSGLADIWIEAGVYSECVAQRIMQGKSWNRAVRAHKLTMEAMWRALFRTFKLWHDHNQKRSIEDANNYATPIAATFKENDHENIPATVQEFVEHVDDLVQDINKFFEENASNATLMFWRQYIDLVETLLLFVRADREADWTLHLSTFKSMLPFMITYDHTNYARWGVIYLLDMLQLEQTAPSVYQEFLAGNFVVKESTGYFNQIATDQALEHVNKQCKIAGGLVGITRIASALNRWMITFSDRARLSNDIRKMVGMTRDRSRCKGDRSSSRIKRDETDVKKLEEQIVQFNPFNRTGEELVCISTNDVARDDIREDLLTAQNRGTELLTKFVSNRLLPDAPEKFHDAIPKNKSKTFTNLNTVNVVTPAGQKKAVKADRDLFRRLLSAASSGRQIDLKGLLQHELSPVPLAIATPDEMLRPTEKADLYHILCDDYKEKLLPETDRPTCVIVDGMAVVQALGKPSNATTFGDLADSFCNQVFSNLRGTQTRLDIVFDDYRQKSIKSGARVQRTTSKWKIRRIIDGRNVRLPSVWQSFISLEANKVNLIRFLRDQLLLRAQTLPTYHEVVVSGGDAFPAVSSTGRDVQHLNSNHEEADTKIILHALDASVQNFHRVVVCTRDTDILLLLIRHETAEEVWMSSGTSKDKHFIPVCTVRENLEPEVVHNILSFHALTGSDCTSQFFGYGKRTAWKTYLKFPNLLKDLGHSPDIDTDNIELFVIQMYSSTTNATSVNDLRAELFHRVNDPEKLPPTHDALALHIQRSNYQAMVWLNAIVPIPSLPQPEECGWVCREGQSLQPLLMRLDPVPSVCIELLTCRCKTRCSTLRCTCRKHNLICSVACGCKQECSNSIHLPDEDDSESDED